MDRDNKKFITQGPLYKVLITLSLPLMLNNFVQQLYELVNSLWLNRLGQNEFAGVIFVFPVNFLFMSIALGIYISGSAILSREIGKGDIDSAQKYASNLIISALFLGLSISIVGYILTPFIVKIMGADSSFIEISISYLRVSILSFIFIALYFSIQSVLNSQGFNKQLMIANVCSLIINMILAPYFIFDKVPFTNITGLGLGVRGAAFATLIAKASLLLIGSILALKYSKDIKITKIVKLSKKRIIHLSKVAFPAMIGTGGAAMGFMVLNAFIVSYGTFVLAAFGLVNRITSLVMQPAMGIGASMTAIIGQNLGAGRKDRVFECFRKANIINLAITLVGCFFFYIFDKEIISFFLQQKENTKAFKASIGYLHFIIPTIPLMGMFSIFQGVFQGASFTKYSMYIEVIRLWVLRLPMILLFKHFTNLSHLGIWISMSSSNLLIVLFAFILYRGRRWLPKDPSNLGNYI